MGNHTWAKKDIFEFINSQMIIRPANYSEGVQGMVMEFMSAKERK